MKVHSGEGLSCTQMNLLEESEKLTLVLFPFSCTAGELASNENPIVNFAKHSSVEV